MKMLLLLLGGCLALLNCYVFAENSEELHTRTFVVPPTFMTQMPWEKNGWKPEDRFREWSPKHSSAPRKSARQILITGGVNFSEGASATYNPATSHLIVRNTLSQMQLVEEYLKLLIEDVEVQTYITFKEAQFPSEESDLPDMLEWVFPKSLDESIEDRKSVSKRQSRSSAFHSYESLYEELSRPPRLADEGPKRVPISVGTTVSDPQLQVVLRAISQKREAALSSPPSIVLRSGQPGVVQKDDQRYAVIPTIGLKKQSIKLSLFLPLHGEALFQGLGDINPSASVTIDDGETVILRQSLKKGKERIVFVTASLIDPAGMPINHRISNENAGVKAAAKVAPSLSRSDLVAEASNPGLSVADQGRIRQADELALKGSQSLADQDYEIAAKRFEMALTLLPDHDLASDRRKAYMQQLAKASNQIIIEEKDIRKTKELSVEEIFTNTILPKVAYEQQSLQVCLTNLMIQVSQHSGQASDFTNLVVKDSEKIGNPKITLRLQNVPAKEALRYVTALAGARFEYVDGGIEIYSLKN